MVVDMYVLANNMYIHTHTLSVLHACEFVGAYNTQRERESERERDVCISKQHVYTYTHT